MASRKALEASIGSILAEHANHMNEIELYETCGFLDPELIDIARQYKTNQLANTKVRLVCQVIYNENKLPNPTETSVDLGEYTKQVIEKTLLFFSQQHYSCLRQAAVVQRITYIVFPVRDLEGLLELFLKTL